MRGALALVLLGLGSGCATTVHRIDGQFPTRTGSARTDCEMQDWLVVSPTRADFVDKHGIKSQTRDDGVALYRVGASKPVSIPSLSDDMGGGPLFVRHATAVQSHDTKQLVASGLGIAGAVAVAVGTILFVSAFGTDGTAAQNQKINGGRLAAGAITIGGGFGLGIAGITVNPGQAERSRAEASRFVFFPPEEPKDDVVEMAGRYNQAVRARCERRSAP